MYSKGDHPPPYNAAAQSHPMDPQPYAMAPPPKTNISINIQHPQPQTQNNVIVVNSNAVGNYPAYRDGLVEKSFICCGICCSIFLFLAGIIFCLTVLV